MLRSEAPVVLLLRTRQAARSDRARRARCFDRCTFRTILSNVTNEWTTVEEPAALRPRLPNGWGSGPSNRGTGLTRGARAPKPVLLAGS